MSFSIVLSDDHPVVRQGLRSILETDSRLTVIGEASDGLEAVTLAERLKPRLLITDLAMPSLSGLEVVRQLYRRVPQTRTLFFTLHSTESHIHEAFRNGASGYMLKGAGKEEILQAVHHIAAGHRYVSPALTEQLINVYLDKAGQFSVMDPYDELTTREREILQLVAEGATNQVVADRLYISARTVEIHRANVMRKLNLKNQSELVRYAIRRGILSLED